MFPEIPVEFLQEKEVFKEFIYRINTLGSCHFPCKSGAVTHVSLGKPHALEVGSSHLSP